MSTGTPPLALYLDLAEAVGLYWGHRQSIQRKSNTRPTDIEMRT